MANRRVGFLLGAGASFELGMPLVTHLTDLFKAFYSKAQFQRMVDGRRRHGEPYDNSVVEVASQALGRSDMHYEAVLGLLQTESRRTSNELLQQYHGIYIQMVEAVYLILLDLHLARERVLPSALPPFDGLAHFAEHSRPLYVFTLNHDVMLEIIADRVGLPIRDGFWAEQPLSLNYGSRNDRKVLLADVLTEQQLKDGGLHFFKPGETGVNLLKLHGGLDVFAFRNGLDLCRLRPDQLGAEGRLGALRIANREIAPHLNQRNGRATNEIMYEDAEGEIQFLRRTLLAGAHKFDERHGQTLPQRMLEIFQRDIKRVHDLFVIGYSFGDAHVDNTVRQWLERSRDHRLTVVDPFRDRLPGHFTHLLPQITLEKTTAANFLAARRTIPLSTVERAALRVLETMRPCADQLVLRRYEAKFARARDLG